MSEETTTDRPRCVICRGNPAAWVCAVCIGNTRDDLKAVVDLYGQLLGEALRGFRTGPVPGGDATVALGPWSYGTADLNEQAVDLGTWELNLAGDWHPLLTLETWCVVWREWFGHTEPEGRATVKDSSGYLQRHLHEMAGAKARDHEFPPELPDLVRDLRQVRGRLEDILGEGERTTPGIRCPKCKQAAMVRREDDRSQRTRCKGHNGVCTWPHVCCDRGGLVEEWRCPSCKVVMGLKEYESHVMRDYIANAEALPLKYVEHRVARAKAGTVKVWGQRGHVRTWRDPETDQLSYVIADIEARLDYADDVLAS